MEWMDAVPAAEYMQERRITRLETAKTPLKGSHLRPDHLHQHRLASLPYRECRVARKGKLIAYLSTDKDTVLIDILSFGPVRSEEYLK